MLGAHLYRGKKSQTITSQRDDALDTALEMLRPEDITRNERTHPLPEDQTLWELYAATSRGRRCVAAQPLSHTDGPATTKELEYEAEGYEPEAGD
ncbi:MAG: hypothetical protein AAF449_00980 [Myxococcota bacterium]